MRSTQAENVICEELDGEGLLVQPHAQRTWLLNPTALFIWSNSGGTCVDTSSAVESMAQQLALAGRRDLAGVRQDVLAFRAQLEAAGLLPVAPVLARVSCAGSYVPPSMRVQNFGSGPRHRPSPRGLSGGPG